MKVVSMIIAALAAGAASASPAEFLVPGPAAIPAGFRQVFAMFTAEQYAVQYDAADDASRLLMSEHTDAAGASYAEQVATLEQMAGNRHGVIPRRLGQFAFDGHRGVIYAMAESAVRNNVLLLDDDGKLLRLSAYDGTSHRFGPDDLIGLLRHFERRAAPAPPSSGRD